MGQLPGFELVVDPPVSLNHYRLISEVLQSVGMDQEPYDRAHLDSCGLLLFHGGSLEFGHNARL